MRQNLNDPVIDEIREVQRRISARFDHDPAKLVTFYIEMQMQKQYQNRLIKAANSSERSDQPVA